MARLTQDEHFDVVADEYDESIPRHVMAHLTRRRVALATSLVPGGRILDVGCGTGTFLRAMPDRFEKEGVDVSAAMLDIARDQGLSVQQASGGDLPYGDASFDVVTTFAVLHHLIDRELVRATVREMCRVTKPGGAVVVWDHNPLNPYWPLLMARLPQDQGDEKLVPARLVRSALRRAGMTEIALRRWTFVPDFTPPKALDAVARLERALESVPLMRLIAAHNVFTARRPGDTGR